MYRTRMTLWINRTFGSFISNYGSANGSRTRKPRRTQLNVECLENREMLSADPLASVAIHDDSANVTDAPALVTSPGGQDMLATGRITDAGGNLSNSFWRQVGIIKLSNGVYGTATVIGKRWLLTAAHVVEQARGHKDAVFTLGGPGGLKFRSKRILMGVNYKGKLGFDGANDIALVQIKGKFRGIAPMQIARSTPRVGEDIYLVGFGNPGNGYQGEDNSAPIQKRWGWTKVDYVSSELVWWRYDLGESNTARGDSGGPQLRHLGGGYYEIISVTSGGPQPNLYNTWSFNTRVDIYSNTINKIVNKKYRKRSAPKTMRISTSWVETKLSARSGGQGRSAETTRYVAARSDDSPLVMQVVATGSTTSTSLPPTSDAHLDRLPSDFEEHVELVKEMAPNRYEDLADKLFDGAESETALDQLFADGKYADLFTSATQEADMLAA